MKYDAFISYRHLDLDMEIAKKVHTGLETYHIPKAVQEKTGKKKIQRVFRDQEELPIGSDLNDNISQALEESEYLLVICSSSTPGSYWVCKEIETFIELHGREHILAVLIEGEPDVSFPPMLLTDEDGNPVEPLAADVRGADKKERNTKFKTEILRLAAPIIGCTYDDLRQRHRERMIKRTVTIASIAASVIALAGVTFGIYNANVADRMQKLADEKSALADEKTRLADEITVQYRGKQENQSRFYAEEALTLFGAGNREDAVLVAMEGLPSEGNDRPYVADAEYALSKVLYAYDVESEMSYDRVLHHDLSIDELLFTYDKKKLVTIDSGSKVYVWDVSDWSLMTAIEPEINDQNFYVSVDSADADDTGVYVATQDTLYKYDYDGGLIFFKAFDEAIKQCKLFENDDRILIVCEDRLNILDSKSGAITDTFEDATGQDYFGRIKKAQKKDLFIIPHYDPEAVNTYVSVFDGQEKTLTDIRLSEGYFLDMCFTANDNIAVVNCNNDLIHRGVEHVMTDLVTPDGNTLWSRDIDANIKQMLTFRVLVRSHEYEEEGTQHSDIVLTAESQAFTLDEETGDLIAAFSLPGDVNALALSSGSSYGRVGYAQGDIDFVDFAGGRVHSEYTIDTADSIKDWAVLSDTLAFSSTLSPDISIMKWHEASDAEEFATYDDRVVIAAVSDDGEYYAVTPYDDYTCASFYDKEGKELSSFSGASFIKGMDLGSDRAYLKDTGGIWIVDPRTGSSDFLDITDYGFTASSFECCLTPAKDKGLFYGMHRLITMDLDEKKVLYEYETEGKISRAVMSPDAGTVYVSESGADLYAIDTGTGDRTQPDDDRYKIVAGDYNKICMEVSPGGRYVGLCCSDGYLRILDSADLKTWAEIPFNSYLKAFIAFTDDESHIIMQGDDYRIRIWDIDAGGFVNTTNAAGTVSWIVCDEDRGLMAVCLLDSLYLYETAGYGCIANAGDGLAYFKSNDSILLSFDKMEIKRTFYKDYKALMEEAKRQFPGAALSDEKKVKYNIN
ncbi:MAG: toll/interleukin-1 receptor domain-containing protein [Lachnospiraceae bacterium]|nr:toll/interleukin-1 receptor domain-containing protein [Lachnospiraceae bacterium]